MNEKFHSYLLKNGKWFAIGCTTGGYLYILREVRREDVPEEYLD